MQFPRAVELNIHYYHRLPATAVRGQSARFRHQAYAAELYLPFAAACGREVHCQYVLATDRILQTIHRGMWSVCILSSMFMYQLKFSRKTERVTDLLP